MPTDLTRYIVWAGVIATGTLFGILDRRWIGRPLFGALAVIGVFAGLIITRVSPFSFGGGGHYMEGVLISAGSALVVLGYVLASVWQLTLRYLLRRGRP